MTAAGTGICDGCDREGPVQQLEEVILPSGAMTVCPECRYHAEELAERSTAECDGCGEAVTAASLARTALPDDTQMILCPDCRESVSAGEHPATSDADGGVGEDETRAGSGQEGGEGDEAAATDAGDTHTAGTAGSADGAGTDGAGDARPDEQSTAASAAPSAGSTGDAVTDGATDKPATTRNTCDQCGGLFSIELYQVTTVDGRTEQFCPDCKDDGIEDGIVRDVELRRAQAYEVLGIAGSASATEIRDAYLEQVKAVHPDRSDGSRSEFILVQQAYERLRDE